jgi:hypothetical protein
MRNWLFEHLTFKIHHLVKSTLENLEKTKTKIHGKLGKYVCRMRIGIS